MPHQDSTPSATIVNTPLWRAMGADRKDAMDLQNALVDRFGRCMSWRELVTKLAEDACSGLKVPDGMDPKGEAILFFDAAAVAGFCLAVTAPKVVEDVELWPERANALMDVRNWCYRDLCMSRTEPPPLGPWGRLAGWLRRLCARMQGAG